MNARPAFLTAAPTLTAEPLPDLALWVAHGWVRELDRAFATFIAHHADPANPLLVLAAALASHQLGRGHACLDLGATLADVRDALSLPPEPPVTANLGAAATPRSPAALLVGVDLATWQRALHHPRLVGDGNGNTPLVLCGARLYLRRYWQYEQTVREAIKQRLDQVIPPDEPALRQALQVLFPQVPAAQGTDWQKVACALAARHGFAVITGGPGTGKTTTVVKLLAVLQHLAMNASPTARRLRIRMAAPTGKAAARLNESIAGAVQRLPLDGLPDAEALRVAIPTEVTTVHRLLGSRPDTRHFRHDARNPLPVDVLVIDEASMVDLEMMASVVAALPAQARLVLLGDKDQLASVEAGAVLGDLCRRADRGHYTAATRAWVQQVANETVDQALSDDRGLPLDQTIVKLRFSHRFDATSGIGRLADAVNAGSMSGLRTVRDVVPPDLAWLNLAADSQALARLALDGACGAFAGQGQGRIDHGEPVGPPVGYRLYLERLRARRPPADANAEAWDAWAREVLFAYGQFQVLCAVRHGAHGVEGLNQRIADLLCAEGLTSAAQGWYEGRPVMVTRNDYALGLMNGDVGITLQVPQRRGADPAATGAILRVAFAAGDGSNSIHWVLPSRLQAVETVYAMTVHKSQGSEFTHAALVLPETPSRVLTRELIYTGITRARHWFTMATSDGGRGVLDLAVERRVKRTGGLLGQGEE